MAIIKRLASEDYVSTTASEIADVKLDEYVPSWNDLSDKPFDEILAEKTVLFLNNSGCFEKYYMEDDRIVNGALTMGYAYNATSDSGAIFETFEIGETYILKIGEIEMTANAAYTDIIHFSGEKYSVLTLDGENGYIIFTTQDKSLEPRHIELYRAPKSDIKTLDPKFIPDTIARVSDVTAPKTELVLVSSTSGSTKQFKLTIDDEGVITATEIVESEE